MVRATTMPPQPEVPQHWSMYKCEVKCHALTLYWREAVSSCFDRFNTDKNSCRGLQVSHWLKTVHRKAPFRGIRGRGVHNLGTTWQCVQFQGLAALTLVIMVDQLLQIRETAEGRITNKFCIFPVGRKENRHQNKWHSTTVQMSFIKQTFCG
jgi:hypothetical protein